MFQNTILSKSSFGKKLQSFRTLRWKSSNQQANKSTETFWIAKTNFRLHKFLLFLKMRHLLGSSSEVEVKVLLDGPGVMKDDLFIDALRAKISGVPIDLLLERLNWLQRLEGKQEWSFNLLKTWENCINYEIMEIRKPVRKAKKFSGWVRNSSAVGSKRPGKSKSEPEIFEWSNFDNLDYFEFLTVGRFNGTSIDIYPSLKRSVEIETVKPKRVKKL